MEDSNVVMKVEWSMMRRSTTANMGSGDVKDSQNFKDMVRPLKTILCRYLSAIDKSGSIAGTEKDCTVCKI